MKQGVLVTAFKEPEWLERVIRRMGSGFSFFVHVDTKSRHEVIQGFMALSEKYSNVSVCSRYRVNWGGNNHLLAILLLVRQSLDAGMGYCHLITGQDYPVKSIDLLLQEGERQVNYLHWLPLPRSDWKDGGYDRLIYYNYFDIFDGRKRWGRRMIHYLVALQRIVSFRRKLPEDIAFYGGNTYWSLSRECLEYALDYVEANPSFMRLFDHSFCSEEFFFQTVLMNSPLKEKIVNDDRRFIVWEFRDGSNPATLDERDIEKVCASQAYFMRKIAYPKSRGVVDAIDRRVLDTEPS